MAIDLTAYAPPDGILGYPADAVLGCIDEARAPALIAELKALGFADGAVMALTNDRRDDISLPVEGGGFRGALKRMAGSMGSDLDLLKAFRAEMEAGCVVFRVNLDGDVSRKQSIAEAYWRHGGTHVSYLSTYTIETMRPAASG